MTVKHPCRDIEETVEYVFQVQKGIWDWKY